MRIRWSFFIAIVFGPLIPLVAYVLLFHLQLGTPTLNSAWCFDLIQKKSAAADAIKGPKLLIVSGSSGLFGISAEEIRRETGFPAVNFGVHAALGLDYILRVARKNMRASDTVLLAFEYELYESGDMIAQGANDRFIDYILARDPEFVRALPIRDYARLMMLTPGHRMRLGVGNVFARRRVLPATGFGVYNVDYISPLGDQLGCTREARPPGYAAGIGYSAGLAIGLSHDPAGFPVLREFCTWARSNGIRVLATFPNIASKPEYDRPEAEKAPRQISAFFGSIGVPVLGEAREVILPPDDFFDTCYHLLHPAAIERTRRLLVHLAPYLTPQPSGAR